MLQSFFSSSHTIIFSSEFLYLWNLKLNFKWLSIIEKMVCLIHNGTVTTDQAFFLKMVILNIWFSINCENLTHFKLEKRRYLLHYWSNQIKVWRVSSWIGHIPLNEVSLEITITVPLINVLMEVTLILQGVQCPLFLN